MQILKIAFMWWDVLYVEILAHDTITTHNTTNIKMRTEMDTLLLYHVIPLVSTMFGPSSLNRFPPEKITLLPVLFY